MTGREANSYIGKTYRYNIPGCGLEVFVRVEDWKQAYGRDLFLCVPVAGSGSTWLALSSLAEPSSASLRVPTK
jgi:hypothetical protein